MRGSKYELKFDYQGKPVNEDEIRQVLKKGPSSNEVSQVPGLNVASTEQQNASEAAKKVTHSELMMKKKEASDDQMKGD